MKNVKWLLFKANFRYVLKMLELFLISKKKWAFLYIIKLFIRIGCRNFDKSNQNITSLKRFVSSWKRSLKDSNFRVSRRKCWICNDTSFWNLLLTYTRRYPSRSYTRIRNHSHLALKTVGIIFLEKFLHVSHPSSKNKINKVSKARQINLKHSANDNGSKTKLNSSQESILINFSCYITHICQAPRRQLIFSSPRLPKKVLWNSKKKKKFRPGDTI